jgi:hypothetical protein
MKSGSRAQAKVILLAFMMMSMTGLSGCDFCKTLGDIGEGIVSGIGEVGKWIGGVASDVARGIGKVATGIGKGVGSIFSGPKKTTTVSVSRAVRQAPAAPQVIPRAAPVVPVVQAARPVVPESIGLIPTTDGNRVPPLALASNRN